MVIRKLENKLASNTVVTVTSSISAKTTDHTRPEKKYIKQSKNKQHPTKRNGKNASALRNIFAVFAEYF